MVWNHFHIRGVELLLRRVAGKLCPLSFVCVCVSVKRVPGLVLGRQSSLAVVMYNRRSMWAHVHASCYDHSWMLLQDAWPGFRRYHHASTGPRTCLVARNPSTYVSILTAGSASPPAHSWCGITSTFMV